MALNNAFFLSFSSSRRVIFVKMTWLPIAVVSVPLMAADSVTSFGEPATFQAFAATLAVSLSFVLPVTF